MKIDVVIPVFRPDGRLKMCIDRLKRQSIVPDKIYLEVTYEKTAEEEFLEIGEEQQIEVHYVQKKQYDHAGIRDMWMRRLDSDIVVFMVQDAVPNNRYMIENLIRPLADERTAVSYGRQVTDEDCDSLECCVRQFCYPPKSMVKGTEDVARLGIRAYFTSNVCAAYKRKAYLETEGFGKKMIASEDMLAARRIMEQGWRIAYAADAEVIHYHNYNKKDLWKRYFDIGVAHAQHPEIIQNVSVVREGMRLVRVTCVWLKRSHMKELFSEMAFRSGIRYMAYICGKHYEQLPKRFVSCWTKNKGYWEEEKENE